MNIRSINLKQHDVQAFLDKRKTQHRIPVKKIPANFQFQGLYIEFAGGKKYPTVGSWDDPKGDYHLIKAPYQPGQILYVKETWMDSPNKLNVHGIDLPKYKYKASESEQFINEWPKHWRASIHMPMEAARIWLRVKDVRVERLQEISQDDAIAEGVMADQLTGRTFRHYGYPQTYGLHSHMSYRTLIDSIHGQGTWDRNDWVFVYELEQFEKPM